MTLVIYSESSEKGTIGGLGVWCLAQQETEEKLEANYKSTVNNTTVLQFIQTTLIYTV